MLLAPITPQQVGAHYDQLAAYYRLVWESNVHMGYWLPEAPTAPLAVAQENLTNLLIQHTPVGPGQRVLDVGCGFGRPAVRLAEKTGCEVVGITVSQVQVKEARRYAQAHKLTSRVTFHHMDAMRLTFEATVFEAVWVFESLLHISNRAQVLAHAARVLCPGGRLVLTDFSAPAGLSPQAAATLRERYAINSLITLAECQTLVQAQGLVCTVTCDLSAQVCKFYAALQTSVGQRADTLRAVLGDEFVAQWQCVLPQQVELAQKLGYYLLVAEKLAG